ncbi:MAG: radical SAM protein [Treponema sp.]|jgi:threonylcarbamoyladenosine tRNA methylthiotransferase MtaB|nr:radical SAM protein [Treponema sp.]
MLSVALQTLGCKLNQLESEAIAESFQLGGFRVLPPDDPAADVIVVNTCTVTSRAEQKARRIIRRALKEHPSACVIVTGCYARLDGKAIASLEAAALDAEEAAVPRPCDRGPLPGRRLFVLSGEKSALLDLPRLLGDSPALPGFLEEWAAGLGNAGRGDPFRFNVRDFSFHSRAFLKIQDGCDKRCSYCRVSLARGPSVSLEAGEVLSRLKALEDAGFAEAVLTGVNISQYRDQGRDLGGLLEYLIAGTGRIGLRLSSIEPEGIRGSLLSVLGHPRIRPHFHLSIQSGSPGILEKMRRTYGPEDLLSAAEFLRSRRDDPFLACDIITGFPGETEEDFTRTYDLCRRIGFAWIHAFPYSRRPGTEAYSLGKNVPERDAVRRVEALLALARAGRGDYIGRWIGKPLEAVIETNKKKNTGYMTALSDNYLRLLIPLKGTPPRSPGSPLRCRIQTPLSPSECLHGPGDANGRFDAIAESLE